MGMTKAFSKREADFSKISKQDPLAIEQVMHKAFINVDEEGTEAAAATSVAIAKVTAAESLKIFRADHPFVFLIRHNPTGSILFMGRIQNPKG